MTNKMNHMHYFEPHKPHKPYALCEPHKSHTLSCEPLTPCPPHTPFEPHDDDDHRWARTHTHTYTNSGAWHQLPCTAANAKATLLTSCKLVSA